VNLEIGNSAASGANPDLHKKIRVLLVLSADFTIANNARKVLIQDELDDDSRRRSSQGRRLRNRSRLLNSVTC